jgi:hypothetical protein
VASDDESSLTDRHGRDYSALPGSSVANRRLLSSRRYVRLYVLLIIPGYTRAMSWGVLVMDVVQPRGVFDAMNLSDCPYCGLPGMVTTMRVDHAGLEVSGKCTICGYSYDSDYNPTEVSQDLPGEFSRPLEAVVSD